MSVADKPIGPAAVSCACGRLRRATRALTQLYDDAMVPAGLRITQFSLLRTLAREGATRIGDLATHTLLDRTALSRNLDPLIARGLVAAVRGDDARTREVTLTAAGERALRAAEPHWRRAQALVRRKLGAAKLDLLIETLGELEALHPDRAPGALESDA
jgi:DNA-binding MarR family transcriptional regulator